MDGRKERGALRRNALMSAATDLAAQKGVSAVTHRAVALSSSVSLASVTYHYPTIAALRDAMFEWIGDQVISVMENAVRHGDEEHRSPEGTAGALAYELCQNHRELVLMLLQLLIAAQSDPQLRPVSERLNNRAEAIVEAAVGTASAPAVVAAMQGVMLRALSREDGQAEWARETVHTLIRRYTHPEP
ncbi:TetR/AcrR family transcriptional regulator [Bifidobacterium psychraerophilum]|uniref:TetR family transcriptional regulator n=1 Tax=Bifidobacterium psychraerophilum TaxID=218140 RepID=A0A087CHZ0_9BIFI|nr:TetR family transcriptional regulator [Bifidobacterium psychraerophilum]KFI82890.1 TetR family transcriptional regulator [Bifidobacterium psychraerophilum]PKA94637.1 TetR family transcriptional regulator [Bifidobacterium psychraerophilum DSM 22366]